MKTGMTLHDLLARVQHHAAVKRDFVASTGAVRMVEAAEFTDRVAVVLLKEGAGELERFELTGTAHRQIAEHLGIPFKYYGRLLTDHRDLVIHQVNALFEREPKIRLLRTMEGHIRAFLSDGYRRLDNNIVLATTLPLIMKGEGFANRLLSCNVTEESMNIKCVFTDEALQFDVGLAPNGRPDIIRPGFQLDNSEVGKGSLRCRSFFHRGYCDNGAVYGSEEAMEFRRAHLGGRLIEGVDFQVISDETARLDDAAIVSGVGDVMRALANPTFIEKMAAKLRSLKAGGQIEDPVTVMPKVAKELGLNETEANQALVNLIRDQDFSRWGVLNAVTAVANEAQTYERANELEATANAVINLPALRWDALRRKEVVAIAA